MARRYDSKEAKRRILTACVRLFLEKGYTNTKVAEILKEADVSAGSFQNIFHTKDGVLTFKVGMPVEVHSIPPLYFPDTQSERMTYRSSSRHSSPDLGAS